MITFLLLSQADSHFYSRERRAQFVRHIRQPLTLMLNQLFSVLGHAIEGARQPGQFVFARAQRGADPRAVIASAEPPGSLLQSA